MDGITVYGVDNCEDTQRTRRFLDSHNIAYEYVNLDQNQEADEMVKEANEGNRRTPYVLVQYGNEARRLHVPSDEELMNALRDFEMLPHAA